MNMMFTWALGMGNGSFFASSLADLFISACPVESSRGSRTAKLASKTPADADSWFPTPIFRSKSDFDDTAIFRSHCPTYQDIRLEML